MPNGMRFPAPGDTDAWLAIVWQFLDALARRKKDQFNRRMSVGDPLTERANNAAMYGCNDGALMRHPLVDYSRSRRTS